MGEKITCFGEVLWDVFKDRSIPGGAPMNVALHLRQLGFDSRMVSMVGDDAEGKELLDFLQQRGMDTTLIGTTADFPTGRVLVNDSDNKNVKYEIVHPVAYDHIQWSQDLQDAVDQSKAFLFGSLAARDEVSCKTLHQLLQSSTLKIFDVNLRPPHYDLEQLEKILVHTDILKVNEEELEILADYHEFGEELEVACEKLEEAYELRLICVTRGENGAVIYQNGELFEHEGFEVDVVDTVGSGDAFLSALIYGYLKGERLEEMLELACALGAFVAGKQGATPRYKLEDIQRIIDAGGEEK
jgi:fructokinase